MCGGVYSVHVQFKKKGPRVAMTHGQSPWCHGSIWELEDADRSVKDWTHSLQSVRKLPRPTWTSLDPPGYLAG